VKDRAGDLTEALSELRKAIEDDVQDKGGTGRAIAGATAATIIDVVSESLSDVGETAQQIGSLGASVGEHGVEGLDEEAARLAKIAELGLSLASRGASKRLKSLLEGASSEKRATKASRKGGRRNGDDDAGPSQPDRARDRRSRQIKPEVSGKAREIARHARERAKQLKKDHPELFRGKDKHKGGTLVHDALEDDFYAGKGPYRNVLGHPELNYGTGYRGPKGKDAARRADLIIDDGGRKVVIEYKPRVVHDPETGDMQVFGHNPVSGKLEVHRSDQIADYEKATDVLGDVERMDTYIISYETGALYKYERSAGGWVQVD
jgi:hypothetical protein